MSGTGEKTEQTEGEGGAVSRPDYIPETIWDGEKNAPKIDLAATITEHTALKAAADERAAKIPAKPEDYSFDLPKDFALPAGYKWEAKPDDPLVKSFRDYAVANKLTGDEVSGLVGVYAKHQADQLAAETAARTEFDKQQTAALGANAEQRRTAAKTWIEANLSKEQAPVFSTLLDLKVGVEAVEAIIDKLKGVKLAGNPGGEGPENKNAANAELVGKPGGAQALLRAAHSGK